MQLCMQYKEKWWINIEGAKRLGEVNLLVVLQGGVGGVAVGPDGSGGKAVLQPASVGLY